MIKFVLLSTINITHSSREKRCMEINYLFKHLCVDSPKGWKKYDTNEKKPTVIRNILYYINTSEISGFFLLLKNHIFISRSEDTIFIFHV